MKNRILVALLFAVSNNLNSQCSVTVPGDVLVVDSTTTISSVPPTNYWVCQGNTVFVTDSNQSLYVEAECDIFITGDSNEIYMHGASNLTIQGGNGNKAVYPGSSNVTDNGSNSDLTLCTGIMIWVYINAPTPGCNPATGISIQPLVRKVRIFPNPVVNNLTIEADEFDIVSLTVLNTTGQEVYTNYTANQSKLELDLSGLKSGIYYLRFTDGEGNTGATRIFKK